MSLSSTTTWQRRKYVRLNKKNKKMDFLVSLVSFWGEGLLKKKYNNTLQL